MGTPKEGAARLLQKMAAQKHIPSAEEIKLLLAAKANGAAIVDGKIHNPIQVIDENAALKLANDRLAAQVRKDQVGKVDMTAKDRRGLLDALLLKYGVEPAEEILLQLTDPANPFYISDPLVRLDTWQKLMEYRTPKLKSVEHEGRVDNTYNVVIVRYGDDGKIVQEKLPERNITPVEIKAEKF